MQGACVVGGAGRERAGLERGACGRHAGVVCGVARAARRAREHKEGGGELRWRPRGARARASLGGAGGERVGPGAIARFT